MKNGKKYFVIVWAIIFAVFNVAVFLIPHTYGLRFWVCYAFTVLAFVGQLGCGLTVFGKKKIDGVFLSLPVLHITYTGTVAMLIVSVICVAIPKLPEFIGAIICFIILAFTALAVIKATAAAEMVQNLGQKVKEKTLFVKMLTVDAESVMARAKSEAVKAEAKRVYEAVRYSDPMSSDALSGIESQITLKFDSFAQAVDDDDYELAKANADELLILINDRNKKCKVLK